MAQCGTTVQLCGSDSCSRISGHSLKDSSGLFIKVGVGMDWMGRTGECVIAHRHRILVLVVLQCLLIGSFSDTIGAAKYRVDELTELHRSLARYRQLREFGSSERDLMQVQLRSVLSICRNAFPLYISDGVMIPTLELIVCR